MHPPDIAFVDGIRSKWEPKTLPLSQFLQQQASNWGSPTFNACECLQHGQMVSLYLDADKYVDESPTQQAIDQQLTMCKETILSMFEADDGFDMERDVIMGYRHGYVESKKTYKISFRFFIPRYHLLLEDVPKLLRQYKGTDIFDSAPYSSRQKLNVPGACKGDGDHRTLQLEDRSQGEWCLAQNIKSNSRVLDFDELGDDLSAGSKRKRTSQPPPAWEEARKVLQEFGFTNPTYVNSRPSSITFTSNDLGGTCPCCTGQHDSHNFWVMERADGSLLVKSYSVNCKSRVLMEVVNSIIIPDESSVTPFMAATQEVFDGTPCRHPGYDHQQRECSLVQQHLESCRSCGGHHVEDMWYIYEPLKSIFSMRNSSLNCCERVLPIFANQHLQSIAINMGTDQSYAELFISEHEDQFTSDGITVLGFDKRWMPIQDPDMQNTVQNWLTKVMKQLYDLMLYEDYMCKKQEDKMSKVMKPYHDMYRASNKYISKEGNMKSLLTTLKRKLRQNGLWKNMDMDPHVLGVNNGLIMLETGTFRPATQQDLVSKSTGYDWEEWVDPGIEVEVEDFFASLYPVEEERRMAQLWGAYTCLGNHPQKKFLMLTDASGGWNGKSAFIKALAATLGPDYSLQGTNTFLYKTDSHSETANSHTAGLLAHKGKRLVTYEELDTKRQLDCGLLKNYNGSRAKAQGRACHATGVEEFEWTAKMILAYNANCMPGFDFTDSALISRMLVLHHRSKFCETEEQIQQEKGPHVFLADPNLDTKLQRWRPYLLRYFIKGCARYFQEGFTNVPEACGAWRQELVRQHDTVKAFVDDSLEHTHKDEDYIERSTLYEVYKAAYPEEKIKKTALGKKKWFDQLQVHLGLEGFYERKRLGDGKRGRDLWLGWKLML